MAWQKQVNELIEYLAMELVVYNTDVKMIFGLPVHFVNGNMMAGVHENSIFVRLSEKDRQEILHDYEEAVNFEPLAGRKMREYIALPEVIVSSSENFAKWLSRSYDFVLSLPPKEPKSRRI